MSGPDPAARLVDLETRLAYQEDTIEKLDAVVTAQSLAIARLEAAIERLSQRLEGMQAPAGDARAPEDERPPHY